MPSLGIAPASRRIAAGLTPRHRGRYRLSGIFPAGDLCTFWRLGFRQFGFRHITRATRHAARMPGHGRRFPGMLFPRFPLRVTGEPSGPGTLPPVPARCTGDTAVRLVAHTSRAAREIPCRVRRLPARSAAATRSRSAQGEPRGFRCACQLRHGPPVRQSVPPHLPSEVPGDAFAIIARHTRHAN